MEEVKSELKVNRVIEILADCGNAGATAIGETLGVQPEELSEFELVSVNKRSGADKKDEDTQSE